MGYEVKLAYCLEAVLNIYDLVALVKATRSMFHRKLSMLNIKCLYTEWI